MVNDPDIDRVACTNANLHLNEHKEVPNEYSSFTCSSHSDGMFGKCDEFPMQKVDNFSKFNGEQHVFSKLLNLFLSILMFSFIDSMHITSNSFIIVKFNEHK